MKWYQGGIAEAVTDCKKKGSVFVVFIEGETDEVSKALSDVLANDTISNKIQNGNFVAIKIEQHSVPHQQLSQIYKEANQPSLFFVGKNGLPLEIVSYAISTTELMVKLDEITQLNAGSNLQSTNSETINQSEDFISNEQVHQEKMSTEREQQKHRNTPIQEASTSNSNQEQSDIVLETEEDKEETLKKYQEIIEQKKEMREIAEKQKEKEDELRRRKTGQDVLKMKRWQDDQDLKQLAEQRDKDKKEEHQARQRILAQIAQDKAERAKKFANIPVSPQSTDVSKSPKPVSNSNVARLQLRLPDGSSHTHEFASNDTLSNVHDFIAANLNMAHRTYTLSTMFPRREFTEEDNSKSMLELELVPNAVILILPSNQSSIARNNGLGGLTSLVLFTVQPIINLLFWMKGWIMGLFGFRRGSTTGEGSTRTNASNSKGKQGKSVLRKDGNVHRFKDNVDTDDDDDNKTWNGNSTQQM